MFSERKWLAGTQAERSLRLGGRRAIPAADGQLHERREPGAYRP